VRRSAVLIELVLVALLVSACGGDGSSSGSGSPSTSGSASASAGDTGAEPGKSAGAASGPEAAWAKEVEGVMRHFENTSYESVEGIHTSTSQPVLEPTYAAYADELAELGRQLEATDPPAACMKVRERMGKLSRKVSDLMGVLGDKAALSREEYFALVYQQRYKFARVGRRLTNLTINPHC
jgi:hypothetical protein